MADWVDVMTQAQAAAYLANPREIRIEDRDARGNKVWRYRGPTLGELERLRAKASPGSVTEPSATKFMAPGN